MNLTDLQDWVKNIEKILFNLIRKGNLIMKICIGIVSWLPSSVEHRRQRIERFNKTLDELDKAFGDNVGYLIVSQNWGNINYLIKLQKKPKYLAMIN